LIDGTETNYQRHAGNKKDNITIIYTPWSNLKKDGSMATGQVSFHNQKLVRKILVRERENAIVNRLNKTRIEKFPDLRTEKEEAAKKKRNSERKSRDQRMEREKLEKREREQLKWQKDHAYDDMFSEEAMMNSSNQDRGEDFLDDFM
jgi:long-subunit acyl-CoA synthetase (AMP-forming)